MTVSRTIALSLVAQLAACGARAELEVPRFDGGFALDVPRDRVAVDRLLARPDVTLLPCDGGALPSPDAVRSTRVAGRFGISAVFDPVARRILTLGGSPSGGTRASPPASLDVDTGASVTLRLEGVTMLPIGAVAVWDARRSRAILVGGRYPDGGFFTPGPGVLDVRLRGDTAVVTPLPDHPLGAVRDPAVAIDPERDVLVMTGGDNEDLPPGPPYGATFTLPLGVDGASWSQRASAADGPPAGTRRQMGWDPERRRMVLAGGWMGVTRDRRAWALEGDRWREVPGVLDGVPSSAAGLVWDPRSCGFVMTVGNCAAEVWLLRVGDRAEMTLRGRLTREGARGPLNPMLFLDEARDELLLLGGGDCQTSGFVYPAFDQIPLRR